MRRSRIRWGRAWHWWPDREGCCGPRSHAAGADYRGRQNMPRQVTHRWQWYVVAVATLVAAAHLGWEHTHGGVAAHHVLHRSDMPAISNWWGLVVLPVLGWLASWSVLRRTAEGPGALPKALAGALGAVLVGVALSASFRAGYEQVASYIFLGALLSGVVLPVYRAEYVLGFVLGMVFVFGAVLPTLAALVAVAISAIVHFLIRPAIAWAVRRMVA